MATKQKSFVGERAISCAGNSINLWQKPQRPIWNWFMINQQEQNIRVLYFDSSFYELFCSCEFRQNVIYISIGSLQS